MLKKFVRLKCFLLALGCVGALLTWPVRGQVLPAVSPALAPAPTATAALTPTPAPNTDAGLQALPQTPDLVPTPTPAENAMPNPTPIVRNPSGEPGDPRRSTNDSYWLDSYPLNDLFQYLARTAGLQYFQNRSMDKDPDSYTVTGELFRRGDPLEKMRELALQYNLLLFRKGSTIYALTQDQITTLPQHEFRYELKYLRPDRRQDMQSAAGPAGQPGQETEDPSLRKFLTNIEHFLTHTQGGTPALVGSVTYERKVNMLVVYDNELAINRVKSYLATIDRPKHQISLQVRVLSINLSAAKNVGVDWSSTLGAQGLPLSVTASGNLNSMFGWTNVVTSTVNRALGVANNVTNGITNNATSTTDTQTSQVNPGLFSNNTNSNSNSNNSGTNGIATTTNGNNGAGGLVFGPATITAILHALYENGHVTIENSPLVITEDNEKASLGVVTRTPIVTSTVTAANGATVITNEVRYRIGADDPIDPPDKRREIGTQLGVVPTILPDGTIRLLIQGTVAIQVGTQLVNAGGGVTNSFPIVNEAHLDSIARVPNGYSLILGGFINDVKTLNINKVPFLGDIPLVGAAFRSKSAQKQRTNLVFIFTPMAYNAANSTQAATVNELNHQNYNADPLDVYADPNHIGHNAETYPPGLRNALADPDEQELDTFPLSPNNPENQSAVPVKTRQQQNQRQIERRYRDNVNSTPKDYLVDPQPRKKKHSTKISRDESN
jgi:type II secretory pathway component GspD/PulD (secretin)